MDLRTAALRIDRYERATMTSLWKGGTISFGGYDWRVLEVRGEGALIVSESLVEKGAYNESKADVTWETCSLRAYLDGEFYDRFSESDKARIAPANVGNADNPWYGTSGGSVTQDRIFLLSIEEVIKHFGDSGQLQTKDRHSRSSVVVVLSVMG
jgi:hypothetical protein